jgi:cytochrome c biogenesis protein CcdA/thiol-disulfide isomerase/thioredoxin
MTVLLAFAFLSGVITILSPCILPVLPIVLSGGISGGKARPFGVLAGFVASFTVFTLTLTAIVSSLGISADVLRYVAVVLIAAFGIVMIVPRLRTGFEMLASRIASRGAGAAPVGAASGGGAGSSAGGGAARRAGAARKAGAGFWGGLPVGIGLGLVWTPCVGPIMASVISLALTQRIDGGAVFITLAYTLGTSIPMLAVMLGGRALLSRVPFLTRNAGGIQKGFGVLMILVAVAIGLGWDRRFQAAVLQAFPNYGSGLTALENTHPVRNALKARGLPGLGSGGSMAAAAFKTPQDGVLGDYGPAPAFVTRGMWFGTESVAPAAGAVMRAAPTGAGSPASDSGPAMRGPSTGSSPAMRAAPAGGPAMRGPSTGGAASGGSSPPAAGSPPLTLEDLRGKVVVVDFWTYSCVNCVRTIPYLKAWNDAYRDKGLVIVGVHTPEFEFEKNPANVARAIKELGVDWPVVQDNDYLQWNAYSNEYWPAHYFIDAKGHVRYVHFGEGAYKEGEQVIRTLLAEAGVKVSGTVSKPDLVLSSQTPETYLGYDRAQGLLTAAAPLHDTPADYTPARVPGNGEWSLSGVWTVSDQYVMPVSSGSLELGFQARNVFLVIEPQSPGGSIGVRVDGKKPADTSDMKGGIVSPAESRLYQLVGLGEAGPHLLHLEVKGKLRLFAFTFG